MQTQKHFRKVLFLFQLAVFVFAGFSLHASAAEKKDSEKGKCFLWKVSSKKATAYLMGSIHVAKKDLYPLDKAFYEAWDKAKVLVVEADPSRVDPMMLMGMRDKMMLKPGESMDSLLRKETKEMLDAYEKRANLNLKMMPMKPWMLAMTITLTEAQRYGFVAEYGLDLHFIGKAKEDGKSIAELEGSMFQLNLLSGFTKKEQDLFLYMTLKEVSEMKEGMEKMMTAWKNGDGKAMSEVAAKSLREYPELKSIYEKLFFKRNEKMAEKISSYLNGSKDIFIIVGAAHIVGDRGLIDLLSKKRGLKIEQVEQLGASAVQPSAPAIPMQTF